VSLIHPTAIIDPSAVIAADVEIGPYSVIGPDVEIGAGSWVGPHVVITKLTTIGAGNKIYQFASVGEDCQDKKYAGEPTRLIIGDNNIIREGCSIHRGTVQDEGVTRIANNNLIMTTVHIAHDVVIGDNTIIASDASIAGHVHVWGLGYYGRRFGDSSVLSHRCALDVRWCKLYLKRYPGIRDGQW